MQALVEVLISGVALGSIYAVTALGLALIYGISRIFNWAYGSFFIWGGYLAWLLSTKFFHLNYPVVFIIVIPVMFFFGLSVERFIIRPLRWKANWQITTMMVTLGFALFLDNAALILFGPYIKSLPPLFKGSINLGGIAISTHEIAIFLIAIFVMAILTLFLDKTRLGMSMGAVSQDVTGAQMMGIPVNKVFGYTFAISAVLAGIAGVLLAPIYFITPMGGWSILIKSFVIVVFGGLGSTKGTLYGAFILGVVESIISWQFGYMWVMIFWFAVLLLVLAIRPKGLFGTGE